MRDTCFYDFGVMSYKETWRRQKKMMSELLRQKKNGEPHGNFLLFVEHPHVYTLGKSGDEANMLANALQLRAKNAEYIHTDRGGDITYHGPGQIVVYPVMDMENFALGVKEYINALEEVIIFVLVEYAIEGKRLEGATGVWLEPYTARARKIAAIGVKCSHYITMHGFALNANTDLSYFDAINPCGFTDKGVTSIAREKGGPIELFELKEKLKKAFTLIFDMDLKDGF